MKNSVRIVWMALILYRYGMADIVEKNCLACHEAQQIPSYLIYKRYLLRYSTPEEIEAHIYRYMKKPKRSDSIMPPQFFLKFPMKAATTLDDDTLKASIHAYVQYYDIKKRLYLEKE